MADIFDKPTRSQVMSLIKSKNTRMEQTFKRALRTARIRFTFQPKIMGKPDFLVSRNVAVFCDSAFWHGKNWIKLKKKLTTGNNPKYWLNHIAANRRRDREVNRQLKKRGYIVLRFWDDNIKKRTAECIKLVREAASSSKISGKAPPKV